MYLRKLAMFLTVAFLAAGCDSKPSTLVEGGYDEAEMDAAIERARAEVDTFIETMKNPAGASDFSVKAPVEEDGNFEYFWLTDVAYKNGSFSGKIGNDPGIVSNVSFGQEWSLKKDEISDWMYMKGGKIHGNYTMRPLLETLPEAEAAELRSMLAEP